MVSYANAFLPKTAKTSDRTLQKAMVVGVACATLRERHIYDRIPSQARKKAMRYNS